MDRPLHADDLVTAKSDESLLAVVERTYADVDTHEPYPRRTELEKLTYDKAIKKPSFVQFTKDGVPPKGTVLVRWHHVARAELIPESKLRLLDRSLLIGDVVKRNASDAMSGVILTTSTKCTLQPIMDLSLKDDYQLKGLLHEGSHSRDLTRPPQESSPLLVDIPASELKYVEPLMEDELVIFKDHLGRIDMVNNSITLRLSDNSVVEIHNRLIEHAGGDTGEPFLVGDIATSTKGVLRAHGRWVYGGYDPNTPPFGTVVALRPVNVEVAWLQRRIGAGEHTSDPPNTLDSSEIESGDFHIYDRTRTPHRSTTSASNTVSTSEIDVRLGVRVRFKDLPGACVKYDGSSHHGMLRRIHRKESMGYDINVFDVVSFRTDVTVQWQDLSITHESSIDLVPDTSIDDEHAAWPGEVVHTLDVAPVLGLPGVSQPSKVGVVQTVNSPERMAKVKWCPDACLQYSEDMDYDLGNKELLRGAVGFTGEDKEEISLYDIEAPGAMNVRRGDIVLIVCEKPGQPHSSQDIDWIGELVDTCLDGSLIVRLGAATEVRDVVVRRDMVLIAVRSDGADQPDIWGDASEEDSDYVDGSDDDLESEDSYAATPSDVDLDELAATYEDENGIPLDEDDVENGDWESDHSDADVEMTDARTITPPTSHSVTPPDTMKAEDESQTSHSNAQMSFGPPEQYIILEGSPPFSHHFVSEPTSESPQHMKRTQKEHKILRQDKALPSGVYVRTWESRLDLLRVLFLGPEETPYANAPFIMDFYLPSTFPTDPPRAYFHSWTSESGLGGVGRVNPNLYEDGKICLSLLGTWEGNKGEGWNASRSTLLQVIVSMLGLVLVREPYFNEAGYEPLVGLESSKRPSALYNERTFLRARTFILKALGWSDEQRSYIGTGVDGVEDVVRWLYWDVAGPQLLEKAIGDIEKVLEKSANGEEEPDGMRIMSRGACIPLRRMLEKLRQVDSSR